MDSGQPHETEISCREFLTRVSDFLDSEGDAPWRRAVEEHCRACPNCAVVLDSTRQTVRILGDEEVFALPAGVSERWHAALDQSLAKRVAPNPGQTSDRASGDPAAPLPAPVDSAVPELVAAGRPTRRAFPAPRRSGLSSGWLLAAALILIALGGFDWWRQVRVRTWNGWLIDAHCAARYEAARRLPVLHPRDCELQAACVASGLGVMTTAGRFFPFDAAGTDLAVARLRASQLTQDLRVTVRGRERRGEIDVTAFRFDSPPAPRVLSVRNDAPAAPAF